MIIDAHQHFWKYDADRHAWIDDEMANIRRDFLPEDLKPVYAENQVAGCIAVQADQTLAENDFLLTLAKENDFVKGIVGWVDFRSENIGEQLEHYNSFNKIKGYRHVVQGEADPLFLLRKDFRNGISALGDYDQVYEILVFPHQLPAVFEFVKLFPKQRFVIDHAAKPYIKNSFFDGWALMMKAISEYENVSCKISGLITEADYKTWTTAEFLPYMDSVLEYFGPSRILYGSDWPVCLVAGKYQEVLNLAKAFGKQLSEAERDRFFSGNAQRIYQIKL